MRKSGFTKFLAVALICVSTLAGRAEALIPVADGASTTNTLKDWFNTIKESKFVTDTVAFANKTSAAIGDAKKSVTDYVIKNKEAAEEKLKQLNEYKKEVEAYKKEYQEYRQMLDENIAAAQRLKAEAQEKLAEAQQLAGTVKGVLGEESHQPDYSEYNEDGSASSGENTGESASAGNSSGSSTGGSAHSGAAGGVSSGTSNDSSAAAGQTGGANVLTGSVSASPKILGGSPYRRPINSLRMPFAGGSDVVASMPAPLTAQEQTALPEIKNKQAAGETLTPEEQQIVVKAAAYDHAAQKTEVAAIKAKLAAGEEITEEERALLTKDDADEAVLLQAVEEKLANGEELTPEEQALLDEKAAEDKAKEEKLASMSEEELREKLAALDKAKLDSWSDEFLYTREELEANLKAKDEAKKASLTNEHAYTTEELEKNLQAKDAAKRSELGVRTRATTRDLNTRTPQRRTFNSGRRASLLDGTEVQSFAAVSGASPLAFAFALRLPDDGTDVNKTYLVSKTINKTCDLTSQKAMEEGAMDECLVMMFDKMKKERAYNEDDFQKNYNQGRKEYAAALIAEGYKLQNDADNFSFDILDKIDYAEGTQTIDHYAHLVEMNKQVVTVINGLLKTYSSRLLLDTYSNYGSYDFSTPSEEENENG